MASSTVGHDPRPGAARVARWGRVYHHGFWLIVAVPALTFLLIGLVLPLGGSLARSFLDPEPGLSNFERFFQTPGYVSLTLQTMEIAALATAFAFLLGYPAAYIMAQGGSRFLRQLILFSMIASQLSSVLTRTFAWQVILGSAGPAGSISSDGLLFTKTATTIGLVQFLLPFMALPLATVMRRINPNVAASSLTLGAGPSQTMFRVFVPMTIAGIIVSTVLVFTYSVGSFATPAILGGLDGTMLGVMIERTLNQSAEPGFAAALSLVLLAIVLITLAVYRLFFMGRIGWLMNTGEVTERVGARGRLRGASGAEPHHSRPRRLRSAIDTVTLALDRSGVAGQRWPHHLFAFGVSAFLLLPQVFAIVISFSNTRSLIFPPPGWSWRWYEEFFTAAWLEPTWTSIVIGVGAAATATVLGGLAAIATARTTSRALRNTITGAMLTPLLVPAVVIAAGLYIIFSDIYLNDTILGLVIAHSLILLPFVFGVVYANVLALNRNLELTAEGLGAGKLRTLLVVVVPQLRGGLLLAFAMGFLISFDEAVIGIFLSDINVTTLPAKMYEAISLESNPTVGAVATLMTVASLLAFLLLELVRTVRRRVRERS